MHYTTHQCTTLNWTVRCSSSYCLVIHCSAVPSKCTKVYGGRGGNTHTKIKEEMNIFNLFWGPSLALRSHDQFPGLSSVNPPLILLGFRVFEKQPNVHSGGVTASLSVYTVNPKMYSFNKFSYVKTCQPFNGHSSQWTFSEVAVDCPWPQLSVEWRWAVSGLSVVCQWTLS